MYYLISTQIMNDDTKAQSINSYANKNEAFSAYDSTYASNYISETLKTWSAQVVDDIGNALKKRYYGDDGLNDYFYLVSIQDTGEANPKDITGYDNLNNALSAMGTTMASNEISETLVSSACFVINKIGGKVDGDYTKKEEPAPEPNEE